MRKHTVIGLAFLGMFGAAGSASAQYTSSYAGLDHINRIVRNTPGVTVAGTGTGVTATASGPVTVRIPSGVAVSVPVNVQAAANRAAIARAAGRIVARSIPFVGAALVAQDIWDLIRPQGVIPCPVGTGAVVCESVVPRTNQNFPAYPHPGNYTGDSSAGYTVYKELPSSAHGCGGSVPAGFQIVSYRRDAGVSCGWVMQGSYKVSQLPPPTPSVDGENTATTATEAATASSPSRIPSLYNNIMGLDPSVNPEITPGTYPLDLRNAPVSMPNTQAVTLPAAEVSTRTITNADGSTSTEKVTESPTVTPTIKPGATVNNPQITFPSTVERVTTTTNNVTNNTTIIREVVVVPSPPPETPPLEIPKDYNKEVTQRSILEVLRTAFGPITAPTPDGEAEINQVKEQNDKGMAAVDAITEDSIGLKNWFPIVPTAACINPQVPIPITGQMINVPICGAVDTFSLFISGVIAFFCVLGCVHQVQTAMRT